MNFRRSSRMQINIFSVNDKNNLDKVYMLLNSIKRTKRKDTTINYRLILEDLTDKTKQYFYDLTSDDFKIQFIDIDWFKQRLKIPEGKKMCATNIYTMVRCLCPLYFKQLDKALYLDTDIVFIRGGIEQLWNTNIDDYYMAGVKDIMIDRFKGLEAQKLNAKNETAYINGGVILFNFKLIRKDKLDQQMAEWCLNWKNDQLQPYYLDQSLLNYLFRKKTKQLNFKYNNYSLVLTTVVYPDVKNYLREQYFYEQPINSFDDAVILHFLGDLKPYKKIFPQLRPICLYYKAVQDIWSQLEAQLRKNE